MFEFTLVSMEDIRKQLDRLYPKKATPIESIQDKILKESSDIFLPSLTITFNSCLAKSYFPNELRNGDISSFCQMGDVLITENIGLSLSCHLRQKFLFAYFMTN